MDKGLEKKILEKQGDLLYTTLSEECAELIQACSKIVRAKAKNIEMSDELLDNLTEEIGDVELNLELIKKQIVKDFDKSEKELKEEIRLSKNTKNWKLANVFGWNNELVEKYPWLKLRNVWTDKEIDNDNEFTWLDDLPIGWRQAFGVQMIEELDHILRKADYQDKYRITQIKEKYGFLRWYDNGVPEAIEDEYDEWLTKYEDLSKETCIMCGDKGKIDYEQYWLEPLCPECRENHEV